MRVIGLVVPLLLATAPFTSEAHPPTRQAVPTPLPAGSLLHAGVVTVQINQVSNSQGIGNPMVTPSPGSLMLVVSFTVTNATSQPIDVSDMPDLSLYRGSSRFVISAEKTAIVQQNLWVSGRPGFGPPPKSLNPGVGYNDVAIFDVARAGFDPNQFSVGLSVGGQRVTLPAIKHWPEDRVSS